MERLKSNSELHQYLVRLVSQLRIRGAADLADSIEFASRQASGISTEFLGESRIALRKLLEKEHCILTWTERKEASDIVKQLDAVLDRRSSN